MPYLTPVTPEEKRRLLFTDEECQVCGGKGYSNEGEQSFTVELFLNSKRIVCVAVLATNTIDALHKATEVLMETYPAGFKPGDDVSLEVSENED